MLLLRHSSGRARQDGQEGTGEESSHLQSTLPQESKAQLNRPELREAVPQARPTVFTVQQRVK